MNTTQQAPNYTSWVLLIVLALIWGSSFILIKKSLVALSSLQVASLRIGISALAFSPVLALQWSKIPRDKLKYLLVVGLAGSAIPAVLFSIAQTQISSSLAGLLNSLTPLFALLISVLFFHQKVGKEKYVGVVLGFAGSALLIILGSDLDDNKNVWFGLLVVGACLCYATSLNTVKHFLQDVGPILLSAVAYCLVGPLGIVILCFTDWQTAMASDQFFWSMASITALALLGTVFASVLFFKLVQMTNVIFSSAVAYLIPLVALGFAFFDGETINYVHFLGMACILSGVFLSREKKKA
ncbi:MAG: DMT family transporter [Bacteroidota bacterium]